MLWVCLFFVVLLLVLSLLVLSVLVLALMLTHFGFVSTSAVMLNRGGGPSHFQLSPVEAVDATKHIMNILLLLLLSRLLSLSLSLSLSLLTLSCLLFWWLLLFVIVLAFVIVPTPVALSVCSMTGRCCCVADIQNLRAKSHLNKSYNMKNDEQQHSIT